jgi:hypothetical protein
MVHMIVLSIVDPSWDGCKVLEELIATNLIQGNLIGLTFANR